ncbi:hypothetical protein OR263_33170 [Streptomyces sp. NEAU-H22]|uniref:hypothetical protein n=1 Tax=Streptomyces sp. NEAU-H22 TaxID=2994655 RepID=UPI0022525880|nr:hypothetical protein [Streptomyces sp. NEAU-H22]MCX3291508.1 hypothetical protein [Streptomyces sp. NEAU-H22]
MIERTREVEAMGGDAADRFAGDGVVHVNCRRGGGRRRDPGGLQVALEKHGIRPAFFHVEMHTLTTGQALTGRAAFR